MSKPNIDRPEEPMKDRYKRLQREAKRNFKDQNEETRSKRYIDRTEVKGQILNILF